MLNLGIADYVHEMFIFHILVVFTARIFFNFILFFIALSMARLNISTT